MKGNNYNFKVTDSQIRRPRRDQPPIVVVEASIVDSSGDRVSGSGKTIDFFCWFKEDENGKPIIVDAQKYLIVDPSDNT